MSSFSLPFPSSGGDMARQLSNNSYTHDQHNLNMKIDIPKGKDDSTATHHLLGSKKQQQQQQAALHAQKQQQQQQQKEQQQNHDHHSHSSANNIVSHHNLQSPSSVAPHHDSATLPLRSSSIHPHAAPVAPLAANWVYHPRQPTNTADSYFPHSGLPPPQHSANSAQPPRTPGSIRGHSRQASGAGALPSSAIVPSRNNKVSAHSMNLNLSTGVNVAGQQTQQPDFHHAGPPSPSTLTDIILGLHSTLYGAKRTPEEVRERVEAFYDQDAVFESPLLSAKGREQIANQFIMAFSLPGMDVTSELRDVICSDFEFDGTRAGIIDQTISVTLLPGLFGSQEYPSTSHAQYPAQAATGQQGYPAGASTPGYTLQSAGITPHPFASYSQVQTPAGGMGSMFSRLTSSRPHSPTTPFSISGLWGSSRPHTPGASHVASSQIRPLSTSAHPQRPSTPPSVNGDDDEYGGTSQSTIHATNADDQTQFMSANEAGGGQVGRPQMPTDAIAPHWTHDGLGRSSFRAFLWGILHPRAALKSLCTIHLRLMSRLEFNDAGLIVRHEDSWGLRETIEGVIPFASVVYALERRVVGYLCSFAIGKGFRLSSALTRSISSGDQEQQYRQRPWPLMPGEEKFHSDANDAARALLLGHHNHRQEQLHSMARSRASSPSRLRFSGYTTPLSHTFGTGSRSRARSLTGQQGGPPIRAASSDNLVSISNNLVGYGDRERGSTLGADSLPPDSSARYRDRGIRRPTTSTASAPVGINSLEHIWQHGDMPTSNVENIDSKSRAPDRDL